MKIRNWQTELPNEEGDWLWMYQWSCGCCIAKSGIAWVVAKEMSPEAVEGDESTYEYVSESGAGLVIHFSHNGPKENPMMDGEPEVTWWQKLDFPPHPEDLELSKGLKYDSMHSHLDRLYGMTERDGSRFVRPFGYSLSVIADGEEMVKDVWTVSVRLNESGTIKDVFAWARPVMKQSEAMHPDAWNDAWLDEKHSAAFRAMMARIMDPNDEFGKRKRVSTAVETVDSDEIK